MRGKVKLREICIAALLFMAAVCFALFAAPLGVQAQEEFENTANWEFSNGENSTMEALPEGGLKISNGQARYRIGLPIGADGVTSVTVRFRYLGTWSSGWQSICFSPSAQLVPNAACFWPQNNDATGIFFVFNADSNGSLHRVFADPLPAGQGHLGEYPIAAGESWIGEHTISLVRNADNTLSVYFDGVRNSIASLDVSNYVDADGMTYLNIDDGNAAEIIIDGISVGRGVYVGEGIIDAQAWTQQNGTKESNGVDELWLSGGQSVFGKGIDFAASSFRSVKVKFTIANVNAWASVGFSDSPDPLAPGACYWGEGAPGVYFVLGASIETAGESAHRVFYTSTAGGKVKYDFAIPSDSWIGEHTLELTKNSDGSLSMYLDGVRAESNTFSVAEMAGDDGILYLQVDDTNGDQVVMEKLVLNDGQSPALVLGGEIPATDLKTGRKIDLPAATANDRADGACLVTITVTDPDGMPVQVEGNSFTPEIAGEYRIRYETRDLSGNTAFKEQTVVVESSADVPDLRVGAWEIGTVKIGEAVTFPEGTATLAGEPVGVTMTLYLPDGTPETLVSLEYTTEQAGVHRLVYSAAGTGDNVAVKEFTFTVLPQLTSADAVDPKVYGDPINWNYNAETAVLVGSGEGITLSEAERGTSASANYFAPISLTDRVKILFTVESKGDWVCFSLTKTPAEVNDFNAVETNTPHATDGIYFMMAGNAYNITSTYNGQFTYLGNAMLNPVYPFKGTHTVEFIRGISGFMLKVDGQECSSGLLGNVLHDTFINEQDESYLAFGIKNVTGVTVTQITNEVDEIAPKIEQIEDMEAVVGQTFEIPQLTATDNKDENVHVSYTLYDAYGRAVDLAGETSVQLIYQGEWRIEYTAYDTSGNRGELTVRIYVELNPDMPAFWLDGTPAQNGRAGVEYVLPEYHVDAGGSVEIKVEKPDLTEEDITETGSFTPEELGRYTVTYTIRDEEDRFYQMLYFIEVKINVDIATTMDPEVFNDTGHWVSGSQDAVVKAEDGLTVAGDAYYEYPLDMSIGIVFDLRLDALGLHAETNSWLGLALMPKAGYGNFAEQTQTGLYLMLYNNAGVLSYNVGTLNSAGTFVYAGSGALGTYEPGMHLPVKIMKYTGGNNQYFDNIVFYINGVENTSPTMYQIHYSDIVDSENFTFLAVSRYGNVSSEVTSMTICDVRVADVIKPVISVPQIASEAKVGDVIDLSGIAVTDNESVEINTEIRIRTPEGFILLGDMLEDGKLTLDTQGRYSITVTATDESGNFEFQVINIDVSDDTVQAGCSGAVSVAGAASGLCILFMAAVLLLGKERRQKIRK